MAQCDEKDERCFSANLLSPEEHRKAMKMDFAPNRPKEWDKNPTTWLTSDEIIDFCKQFEFLYPMKFLGPSPSDYFYKVKSSDSCYWPELCRFNLGDFLKKGTTLFCVSFNVDKHNSDGSHWVSVFVNAGNPTVEIFYFDSAGDGILPDIKKFTDMVAKQARDLKKKVHYDDNETFDHQKGDTECGMYSLFFFATMLEHSMQYTDRSLSTFFEGTFKNRNGMIEDARMEAYRHTYFNEKYE
jgi:Ulp1 protease family, C-terminal catalytic domain